MFNDYTPLELLISQDFTIKGSGDRWRSTVEHDSLVIDRDRQLFFWNSRGISGDMLTYLIKIKGIPREIAARKVRDMSMSAHVPTVIDSSKPVPYEKLVEIFYNQGKNNREYWYSKRGYTDATIDSYRLGYDSGFYTIPLYDLNGKFIDFQLKNNYSTIQYYGYGSSCLFNNFVLEFTDSVVVTEGPVDAIILSQYGIPAVASPNGAGFWSSTFFPLFKRINTIYVVYDNDMAGRNGSLNTAKSLGSYRSKIFTFDGFDDRYDVTDFFTSGHSKTDFLDLVKDNSKYIFELE